MCDLLEGYFLFGNLTAIGARLSLCAGVRMQVTAFLSTEELLAAMKTVAPHDSCFVLSTQPVCGTFSIQALHFALELPVFFF